MDNHYTYLHSLGVSDHNYQKVSVALAVAVGMVAIGTTCARTLSAKRQRLGDKAGVIPDKAISTAGVVDFLVESFVGFQDSILGKENRKYLPLTATVFFYYLALNLFGLIPGVPAATTSVWTTLPVALMIFIVFNYYGIKEHGVVNYLKHFAGPAWWMAWLMFPLEIFGAFLRILTLNLRLYWNISADHQVLGAFTELVPLFVPVVFYILGTFVCFMQAFIPTILTMIYIMLATQHEEGEEHH